MGVAAGYRELDARVGPSHRRMRAAQRDIAGISGQVSVLALAGGGHTHRQGSRNRLPSARDPASLLTEPFFGISYRPLHGAGLSFMVRAGARRGLDRFEGGGLAVVADCAGRGALG
jgi:hypothetical protein